MAFPSPCQSPRVCGQLVLWGVRRGSRGRLLHLQCEWLLGDRKPSPEELDKGIDPDSPLFQAILDNPVVQLGLTNPKTLLGTWPSLARACCAPQMSPSDGGPASVHDSGLSHCGAGAQALPAGGGSVQGPRTSSRTSQGGFSRRGRVWAAPLGWTGWVEGVCLGPSGVRDFSGPILSVEHNTCA